MGPTHALARGFPGPRQQIAEALRWVIGDPRQDVGEPHLWVDVRWLCRLDQREHDGGVAVAGVGAAEVVELVVDRLGEWAAFIELPTKPVDYMVNRVIEASAGEGIGNAA